MRKPQRHALRWFAFTSNVGEKWTAILATAPFIAAVHDGGAAPAVGLTIFDLSIVVVDCGLPRAEQDETLLHELMHVASHDRPGLRMSVEEPAVTHISPSLHPLCVVIGGLKWPPRPAGIAALEKLARTFHT